LKISFHFCQLFETYNSTSISAWASHPDSDLDQVVHKKKNRLCKTGCYWLSLYIDGAWREIPVDRTLPKGQPTYKENQDNAKNAWCRLVEKAFAKYHGHYRDVKEMKGRCFISCSVALQAIIYSP
jgi:hypothetical protein